MIWTNASTYATEWHVFKTINLKLSFSIARSIDYLLGLTPQNAADRVAVYAQWAEVRLASANHLTPCTTTPGQM